MKRQRVEDWTDEVASGESVTAFVVGGPSNGGSMDGSSSVLGSHHAADLQGWVDSKRLDPQRRIGPASNLCAVLTDRRVLIASLGGVWGARPKELLQAGERGEFTCEWWINDVSEAPAAAYVNLVFNFRDGPWAAMGIATKLLGRTVAAATLADEFTSALGPDGVEIDWRETPPV